MIMKRPMHLYLPRGELRPGTIIELQVRVSIKRLIKLHDKHRQLL